MNTTQRKKATDLKDLQRWYLCNIIQYIVVVECYTHLMWYWIASERKNTFHRAEKRVWYTAVGHGGCNMSARIHKNQTKPNQLLRTYNTFCWCWCVLYNHIMEIYAHTIKNNFQKCARNIKLTVNNHTREPLKSVSVQTETERKRNE